MKKKIKYAVVIISICTVIFGLGNITHTSNFTTKPPNNQCKNLSQTFGNVTPHEVIPCGELFGIKFYTKGTTVIKCCDIGGENPGKESGLMSGDTILYIDDCEIKTCSDVEQITQSGGGKPLKMSCLRNGSEFDTEITPIPTDDGFRLGLWIKDSAAGLGTMTFYDPENMRFASLGHAICDDESGKILNIDEAEITKIEVSGITKGKDGVPGIINGYFDNSKTLGTATINNEYGLYGYLTEPKNNATPIEIANIYEIHKGEAQILCSLKDNQPKLYNIEITKINYDDRNKTKNLQITITDSLLTEQTGGIVQGMSGCPIIQDGKLAGAVTHVLLTNSAKGYGIFAQNMYEEMEKAQL